MFIRSENAGNGNITWVGPAKEITSNSVPKMAAHNGITSNIYERESKPLPADDRSRLCKVIFKVSTKQQAH